MCKGLAALPASCLKSAKDIKHKIGFLLQKPDLSQEQKVLKEKAKVTAVDRISSVDAENWKTSFSSLVKSEDGRKAFSAFLRSEYSQENIEFWEACEDFKQTSHEKMNVKAKEIFERYVETDSPFEVNLDSATRELTRQNLFNGDVSCFDEAQSKIFTLMEKDSYRRFLKSKLFLEMFQSLMDRQSCSLGKKEHVSDSSQLLPIFA